MKRLTVTTVLLVVIYFLLSAPGWITAQDKYHRTLLTVNGPSEVDIAELWTLSGVGVINSSCYRSTLIDSFETLTPNLIRIFFHDINHHILWSLVFLTPNTSWNLTWITTENYHASHNGAELKGNITVKDGNGKTFLSNDSSKEYIYAYQGVGVSTTENIILMTKDGYPYPLSTYNPVETSELFQQGGVTEINGFDTLHIKVNDSGMDYRPIVNGISILTMEDLTTVFSIEYTNYGGEICSNDTILVAYKDFEGVCNGTYTVLSPIRPQCLRITFSRNVTIVKYELYVTDDTLIESSRISLVAQYDKNDETTTAIATTDESVQTCSCGPVYKSLYPNMTNEQLEEMLKEEIAELKANLTVNTDTLSSTIRKKSCANDSRESSQVTGCLAAIFIGLIFGVIFLSDFINVLYVIIKFVRKYF